VYEPGSVIAGKYRVEYPLGRGGMGYVVAAEHVDLRTRVALKFLSDEYAKHDVIVERFLREARSCARLRSEHVCKVADVGRLDSGVPFIVMELLEGADLSKVLRQHGPLDVATAAGYVIQACDALREAHAAGIIHRDLKPANLFLVQRADGKPLVKVLDFGVAKANDDRDHSITKTETVMGSPHYMAPEQLRSARFADARSDVWSLGVVLAELTSGEKPFDGESTIDLALKIVNHPPRLAASLPPAYATIVGKCLQKDPIERFQSVGELVAALEPIARNMVATLQPPVSAFSPIPATPWPAVAPLAESTTLGSASTAHSVAPARTRRVGFLLGAVVVAAALGVGIARLVKTDREPPGALVKMSAPVPAPPAPAPAPPVPVPVAAAPEVAATRDAAVPDAVTSDAAAEQAVDPVKAVKHAPPIVHHHTKEELGASRK
jgi:serine/threonine-protein kinase